jgi:23S rRNA pseudouridine2457 synthase
VILALHKPYGYLSRFTPDGSSHRTLAELGLPARVYPVGRLDADSEGLLLLSDEPWVNDALLNPRHAHRREYWVEVERVPDARALRTLEQGVMLDGVKTLPAIARDLEPQPELPPRDPPVRFRKSVPTRWISLSLVEGKNRQVRRMTAAVGHPTLRLVRMAIGCVRLDGIPVGTARALDAESVKRLFARP